MLRQFAMLSPEHSGTTIPTTERRKTNGTWKNKRYISGVAKRKRESLRNHESTRKNVNFYQNFQILQTLKTSLFDKSFNFDTPLSQCLSLEHKSNLETRP